VKQKLNKNNYSYYLGWASYRTNIGLCVSYKRFSIRKTCDIFGCSRAVARYWATKVKTRFHSKSWGGKRTKKFTETREATLKLLLWSQCKLNPLSTIPNLVNIASKCGFKISKMYVSRLFKSWRWSFKKPERKQILKYTKANLLYYGSYITSVNDINWNKLKFLDEAHFVSKDLHKVKAIGPKGERTHIVVNDGLNTSCSITVLTSLSDPKKPLICTIRNDSNSQYDFNDFILYCIKYNHLQDGDYLILDNAAVHVGNDTTEFLLNICKMVNVKIVFLPAYSPELNPCELVFSNLKTWIRNYRVYYPKCNLWYLIALAIINFDSGILWKYYYNCIDKMSSG